MDSSAIVWLFCLIGIFGFAINGLLKRTVLSFEATRRRDSEMSERCSSASESVRSGDSSYSNSDSDRLLARSSLTSNFDDPMRRVSLMRHMGATRHHSHPSIYFQDEIESSEITDDLFSDYKDLPPPDYEEAQRFIDEEQPPPSYNEYMQMINSIAV